jgi:hypothetical protein
MAQGSRDGHPGIIGQPDAGMAATGAALRGNTAEAGGAREKVGPVT